MLVDGKRFENAYSNIPHCQKQTNKNDTCEHINVSLLIISLVSVCLVRNEQKKKGNRSNLVK